MILKKELSQNYLKSLKVKRKKFPIEALKVEPFKVFISESPTTPDVIEIVIDADNCKAVGPYPWEP